MERCLACDADSGRQSLAVISMTAMHTKNKRNREWTRIKHQESETTDERDGVFSGSFLKDLLPKGRLCIG